MKFLRKMEDSVSPENAGSQNLSLSYTTVWGGRQGNCCIPWVQGADGKRGFAESKPKLYLSMVRKIIEIPKETQGHTCSPSDDATVEVLAPGRDAGASR